MTFQEEQVVNFAYASRLGSGAYDVNGRTVQIYRFPLAWTPVPGDVGRPGFRIKLPVTIGFIDFKPTDVVENDLPEDLDTVSFVPGLELLLRPRENWRILPFVEAGIAKDRAGETSSYTSAAGIRSVADFTAGRFRLALGNELLYAMVDPSDDRPTESFLSLENGFEARHDMGFALRRRQIDYGLYGSVSLSWDNPRFPLRDQAPVTIEDQYEVGVTFGTRERVEVWGVGLPRLGIGYRFTQGLSVFRFVIGIPARSLER